MSLRSKLFSAMTALILFMTGAFLAVSHGYMARLFENYAIAARQGDAQQWATMLSYYYVNNHNSWAHVDRYVGQVLDQKLSSGRLAGLERLMIESPTHKVIFTSDTDPKAQALFAQEGINVPIRANGKEVGVVMLTDHDLSRLYRLEQKVLDSMADAALLGAVFTALVALLIAAWFSRLITSPLSQLLSAIRRISKGDLATRIPPSGRDELGQVAEAFNQMSSQLARIEEVRRLLVANVAHELRTPLTIMQGQLELIQQGVQAADPSTLLPIQDEVMRLTHLVDDLHQLTLAEAGVLPLELESTDVVAILSRVLDNFQIEAEATEVHLVLDAPDAEEAWVDANRITQVFVNLIGNAIRYTPQGGTVTARVQRRGKNVEIAISDTGVGIDEENLAHIFDRFYRVDPSRTRDGGGMGLGLAIAKEFVEAHGGEIKVSSRPGEGSTFVVTLPRAKHGA